MVSLLVLHFHAKQTQPKNFQPKIQQNLTSFSFSLVRPQKIPSCYCCPTLLRNYQLFFAGGEARFPFHPVAAVLVSFHSRSLYSLCIDGVGKLLRAEEALMNIQDDRRRSRRCSSASISYFAAYSQIFEFHMQHKKDKEISDDDDDDRNHKHRRRDTRPQSPEREQSVQLTRPYRKYNKPFQQSEKRRQLANYSRASSDLDLRFKLNQQFSVDPGPVRGRGWDTSSWYQRDPQFSSIEVPPQLAEPGSVPSAMFAGTGLPNVSNSQSASWNSFGLIPGIPNGAVDAINPLGWQGMLGPTLNPSINVGILRQRCRDFEERGFCLRGDMCPMEHGVNRIVVDDVQSLSQFNLPVSLSSAPLLGTSVGAGLVPPFSAASSTLINRRRPHRISKHRGDDDIFRLDGVPGPVDDNGTDVYDPDQPLWNNDQPQTSNSLLVLHPPKIDESESLIDAAGPFERLVRSNGAAVDLQNTGPSVWGRVASSKDRFGGEKVESRINSSNKMQEVQVVLSGAKGASYSVKRLSSDGSAPKAGDSSSKPQDDTGRHARKPSQNAQRTLFINYIPLKDNKRETLEAHFRKFGEVIDIYIPSNSERAFVQFSKREEAQAALKAPDAVMGNRFIRMWWANRDRIPDNSINSGSTTSVMAWDVSSVSVPPNSTISKRKDNLSVSIPKVSLTHASDHPVTPGNDSKSVVVNGPKASPALQKKLQSLELLEEIRKKQELLDQKRNEFRRQLDKLDKQATGIKGHTPTEQASKRLRVGMTATPVKSENSRSSEPVASAVTSKADVSMLEPQTVENCVSHGGIVEILSPLLPESPISKKAYCAAAPAPREIDVPRNKRKSDSGPAAFTVNPPLPSGLADVDTLRHHFSPFGELSHVELQNLKVQDDNYSTSDPETAKNCSAHVCFTSHSGAERAFRDGKSWCGHNLQFTWIHVSSGDNSPACKEYQGNLAQSASIVSKSCCRSTENCQSAEEGKRDDTPLSISESRGTSSPSLEDCPGAGAQSVDKSADIAVLEEDTSWKTDPGIQEEEEESYIELGEADDNFESSPAPIPEERQFPEDGVC
ncbi:hypothetical protein Dimus_012779 [Dionaea muscipula]